MPWIELSKRQQGTVGVAVTLFCGLFIVLAVIGMVILLGQFVAFFSAVLAPLVVASILATLTSPYYRWLLKRVRKPALAVVIVLVSIVVPLVALFAFFGSLLVTQIGGFLHQIPVWFDEGRALLQKHAPALNQLWVEHGLDERLRNFMQEQGGQIARGLASVGGSVLSAGASVFRAITGLLGWVVMPVYFVFLLQASPPRADQVSGWMPFLKPETRRDVIYLGSEFVGIMTAFFRGQLLIALIQGVIYGVGFLLVGLKYGLVIGLLMGLLNVIPYLGSLIGLAIALPTAFFQTGGGPATLALTGTVILVAQCTEGYVLTPRIMGDRTGLHPMAIIFAMFFWGTAMGGVMGMVLAIPLTAFLVVCWRLLKAKYIKEIV